MRESEPLGSGAVILSGQSFGRPATFSNPVCDFCLKVIRVFLIVKGRKTAPKEAPMATRIWFGRDTPLPAADRQILNRATRQLEDEGVQITGLLLTHIRTAYRPGMSARNLAAIADPRDSA